MPDINNWVWGRRTDSIDSEGGRAVLAWNRIQRNPTTITPIRRGVAVSSSIVRIEPAQFQRRVAGVEGELLHREVTVFGVRDHPAEEVPDTNLRVDDRFFLNDDECVVTDIFVLPGEIQAQCEAWPA